MSQTAYVQGQFASLVGRKISTAVKVDDSLFLNMADGEWNGHVELRPWNECCGNTFIQHVSGADALRDAMIVSVEKIEARYGECVAAEGTQNDALTTFGHVIKTNRGTCSIEMRSEHNGYYNGSLEVRGVPHVTSGESLDDF